MPREAGTRKSAGADPAPDPAGQSDEDIAERVTRLEAWAEAVMRAVASLAWYDWEALLAGLDEARGADYAGEDPRR